MYTPFISINDPQGEATQGGGGVKKNNGTALAAVEACETQPALICGLRLDVCFDPAPEVAQGFAVVGKSGRGKAEEFATAAKR